MIVRRDNKWLLIERRKPPFGFAPPAGHVDGDPDPETSARRELKEEVGLVARGALKLVLEQDVDNVCRRPGGTWHHWQVYEVEASGDITPSPDETKQARWVAEAELSGLVAKTRLYLASEISEADWQQNPGLEPVWYGHFLELGIIE